MNASFTESMKRKFIDLLTEMDSTIESVQSQEFSLASGGDEADQWGAERDKNMLLKMGDRAVAYRKKLLQGLQKMSDGTYGKCEDCGCDIPVSRLIARPTAEFCVVCKEQAEKSEFKKKAPALRLM